jgi:hypothetical protein
MAKQTGIKSNAWKGIKASYTAKHNWVRKWWKSEIRCTNDINHKGVIEMANISGKYLRRLSDYMPLCRKCHRQFDLKNKCKRGHLYTKENTRWGKNGQRECWECHKFHTRNYYQRLRNKNEK